MRVVVVDDQSYERLHMRILFENCHDVELVGEFSSIADAEKINRLQPDAIFLDIDLGDASGFDLLPLLTGDPKIVFVTLYDQYTLQAFQINAMDYLMKPVTLERLSETLTRLFSQKRLEEQRPDPTRLTEEDMILIKEEGRRALVPMRRIVAICSDGDFTRIHIDGLSPFLMRRRMKDWLAMLPESMFVPLDRSILVNRQRLLQIQMKNDTRSELLLDGCNNAFELGKTATRTVRRLMKD